jgi:hypothetical protein
MILIHICKHQNMNILKRVSSSDYNRSISVSEKSRSSIKNLIRSIISRTDARLIWLYHLGNYFDLTFRFESLSTDGKQKALTIVNKDLVNIIKQMITYIKPLENNIKDKIHVF